MAQIIVPEEAKARLRIQMTEKRVSRAGKQLVTRKIVDWVYAIHGWTEDHVPLSDYDWEADGKPILLRPLIAFDQYIGAVDMGEGLDLLWDGANWERAKNGIFRPDVVFLTDYYGYPEGALFLRAGRKNA